MTQTQPVPEPKSLNFIEEIIEADLASGKHQGRIGTRFPPEPNGYLHIGHAKSICINFGLAQKYGGSTNLRFDDTNPAKEDVEYVDSIREDVAWLGFQWAGEHYASDYFQQLYDYAEYLIQEGKAYVCDLKDDEIKDGARVLRAKIDVQSPNMNLRDPLMYRIRRVDHHRTGDAWPIYPMYDYAHGVSDAIECITHSICTLEFEDHRPLYEWFLNQDVDGKFFARPLPRQIEFARLNLTHTVMSKRRLLLLVQEGHVTGWDDPRMPTICGLRRRGFTPESVRTFAERVGVAKRDMVADVSLLEHCIREDREARAPRAMAVLRPLKVVITNLAEGETHWLELPFHPEKPEMGTRRVPLTREIWIDQDDFREEAPKKWFRLAPGAEVRLRGAALVRCEELVKAADGQVVELRCTWDPQSLGGNAPDGRKVKGTIHWVSAVHAIPAQVRLYEPLFTQEDPMDVPEGGDWRDFINPHSLETVTAQLEPSLADPKAGASFQFERTGYFAVDPDSRPGGLVFNRTVSLKDSWAKIEAKG